MHRGRDYLKTGSPGLHLVRGLSGLGARYCYYFAIAHLSLALAALFNLLDAFVRVADWIAVAV